MTIYDDLKSVSVDLFDQFDQKGVSLVKVAQGSGTPDNPGTPTETTYPLKATVSGVSYQYVKTGFAVATDLMVSSAPLDGVTVSENDFIETGGERYKIVKDMSSPAVGVQCVWKFVIRKGG